MNEDNKRSHCENDHVTPRINKEPAPQLNVLLFIFRLVGVKTNFGTSIRKSTDETIVPKTKIPIKVVGKFWGENEATNESLKKAFVENKLNESETFVNIFPGIDVSIFNTETKSAEACKWISFDESYCPRCENFDLKQGTSVAGLIFENKNNVRIVMRGQLSIRQVGAPLLCFTPQCQSGCILTNGTMVSKTQLELKIPPQVLLGTAEFQCGNIFYPEKNYNLIRLRIEAVHHDKPCSNGKIRVSVNINNQLPQLSVFLDDSQYFPWKVRHIVQPNTICWAIGFKVELEKRILSSVGNGASYAAVLPDFFKRFFFGNYEPDLSKLPDVESRTMSETVSESAVSDFL